MEEFIHKIEHVNTHSWVPMQREDVNSETMEVLEVFVDAIPHLPVHVHEILKIVSDFEKDTREIAKVASSDPAMVSRILKTVNSSYYGLPKKTDNLNTAIVILGLNEIRKIVLQSGFSQVLGEDWCYKGYDTKGLWEHSYLVSICAEALSKGQDTHHVGELMTLGILHDIGKYALFKLVVILKRKRLKALKTGRLSPHSTILKKEEQLFGINHAIMGSMLARKWELSERICSMIECHHYPSFWGIDTIPSDYVNDIVTICFSDLIVKRVTSKEEILPEPSKEYFSILGLKPPLEHVITDELKMIIENAKKFIMYIQ